MPDKPRFVLDTNVVVSALLLKGSVARQAFDGALAVGEILISAETIAELHAVLHRKGFERYVTEEERAEFLVAYVQVGRLIKVTHRVRVCRDPADNRFLELALSGRATCLVSGDKDLLVLHPFRGIPILSPRRFVEVWGKRNSA